MTTKTSTAVTSAVLPRHNGALCTFYAVSQTFNGTTASAGLVFQMLPVREGDRVAMCEVAGGPDGDPCGITVGDGIDANRYLETVSVSSSSTFTRCNAIAGHNYTYSADDTIDITVDSVGSATATGTFYMRAIIVADRN